ncbi:MAG: GNAT family N-acetyltransferase [Lachnospiraceae bacterium]|nr:GNAT family N-acetyltransferase [Lachnospiraceae bacterium]
MKIKKLEGKERFDAYMTAVYCFHVRVEDPEAERAKYEADTKEDWGAFDENGTLMGRIINHKFDFYLDGKTVRCGGIGGVATLPEYRDKGVVKSIYQELLPAAYKDGEVISALYPFKHEFYRKQGYEVVPAWNDYSLRPGLLCKYRFDGEVCKWNMGDPITDFMTVYNVFAPKFNLALRRTEERMLDHLKVDKPYIDRKFSYVMKQEGKPIAYVIFTDIRHDPAAILQVEECAWTGREGFHAILGFLARFEADYGTINITLPKGIELLRIVRSPLAYDIQKIPQQNFMVRVINAKKLLEAIYKPLDCDFTIKVSDEIIKENNATYRVQAGSVKVSKKEKADMELNQRALAQLAVGSLNLDEAKLRMDVTVNAKEEMLRRVFVEKNIFVGEHF